MVEMALGKSIDCSFDRSVAWKEVKFTSRVKVYCRKNKTLPFFFFFSRKLSIVINLPPGNGWSHLGMVSYWGLSVDFCCWQIGHSESSPGWQSVGSCSSQSYNQKEINSTNNLRELVRWFFPRQASRWENILANTLTEQRTGILTYRNCEIIMCAVESC